MSRWFIQLRFDLSKNLPGSAAPFKDASWLKFTPDKIPMYLKSQLLLSINLNWIKLREMLITPTEPFSMHIPLCTHSDVMNGASIWAPRVVVLFSSILNGKSNKHLVLMLWCFWGGIPTSNRTVRCSRMGFCWKTNHWYRSNHCLFCVQLVQYLILPFCTALYISNKHFRFTTGKKVKLNKKNR